MADASKAALEPEEYLLSTGVDGKLRSWAVDGNAVTQVAEFEQRRASCAVALHSGLVAWGCSNGQLRITRVDSRGRFSLYCVLYAHDKQVKTVAATTGHILVSVDWSSNVALHETWGEWTCLHKVSVPGVYFTSLLGLPDGRLAVGREDGQVEVWKVGPPPVRPSKGFEACAPAEALALHPTGQLCVGSFDYMPCLAIVDIVSGATNLGPEDDMMAQTLSVMRDGTIIGPCDAAGVLHAVKLDDTGLGPGESTPVVGFEPPQGRPTPVYTSTTLRDGRVVAGCARCKLYLVGKDASGAPTLQATVHDAVQAPPRRGRLHVDGGVRALCTVPRLSVGMLLQTQREARQQDLQALMSDVEAASAIVGVRRAPLVLFRAAARARRVGAKHTQPLPLPPAKRHVPCV